MLFSVLLQFPTRQSFALLKHCMFFLAFPSTYQILQKHFYGSLSLQGQFLHFSISTIFWSLFSNPGTFPIFTFLVLLLLHQLGEQYQQLSPFVFFLSITIRSGCLASIRLSHWIFMSHSTLISSFSTAPSGTSSYHFSLCSYSFFLQIFQ